MAIGDTINAALMRFDTSPLERAGMANAQANAAFGNALNQVARGFLEGQEKKARTEEMTGYLMNQGISESDAKAIAKNPFLQKEYQRKKETEAQMEIEKNRLAMQAQSNQLSRDKFGLDKEIQERAIKEADELKDLQRGIARFQTTGQELPITQKELDDPNFVPPPLDPDPFVAPPTTYTTQAPAVERLPESFQPQGQRVIDAINKGDLTPMQGNRILEQIEKRAIAEAPEPMTYAEMFDLQAKIKAEERAARKGEQDTTKFEDEMSFLTFKPDNNFLIVRGQKVPVSGKVGNQTVASDLKATFIPNFNHMDGLFSRLMEISEKESFWDDSTLKSEANALVKSIQGQMREEVLGPGTVTDSERAILDDIVQNPFVKGDNLSAKEAMDSLSRLRTQLTNKFQNKLTNLGLQVGQPATSVNQAQSNNSLTTRDGADVEFIDLTQ